MPTRGRSGIALLILMAIACALVACRRAPAGGGLLAGRQPIETRHVERARLITDGFAEREGSGWNTNRTAVLESQGAEVVYDLGSVKPIRAAWLQGDNNDSYILSVSDDDLTYQRLWVAGPVKEGGSRSRSSADLNGSGRYIRLTAIGGDGHFSVSELQVFSALPAAFPPDVPRLESYPADQLVRTGILLLGLALMLFVVLCTRRTPRRWVAVYALLPLSAAAHLAYLLSATWPVDPRGVALTRGTIAAVAAVVVAWEAFAPARFAPKRAIVATTLAVCALGAVMAFYNLGRGQFWNEKLQTWSFVHVLDLRQYYATAKYFPEIGYVDLFDADMAAYTEDTGIPLAKLDNREMRNLHTNLMGKVGGQHEGIEHVKAKFSPKRWEEYKHDARYFRKTMGTERWLHYMVDLGGNATPVWISVAYVLFNALPANHAALLGLALLDPLLFLLMFVAIWRVFGWRTMLVCMIVFGTTDFVMYGSNWAGAVLRHDWLVYLGLGACALKRKRWVLGGFLFGLSTAIRAFPAFAVIGASVPAVWWIVEEWRAEGRFPKLKEIYAAQKPTFTVGFASVGTLLALVGLTSLILGPHSWIDWYHKVSTINAEAHVNPLGLRRLIADVQGDHGILLLQRSPLLVVGLIVYVGMFAVACRKKPLEQAAVLGLLLLPILMFAANYYEHLVCLLPLVVVDRSWHREGKPVDRPLDATDAVVWLSLLLMCAAEYFTTLVQGFVLHFYMGTALLMAMIFAMLLAIVRRDGVELLPTEPDPP